MSMAEEIKLEYEITQIQKNTDNILVISKKMPYNNYCEFQIEFTYSDEKNEEDIVFILDVLINEHKMHLYAKNLYPYNDGSDLIQEVSPEITNNNYTSETKLSPLLLGIKNYIANENKSKKGKFYLGDLYDISLIKSLKSKELYNNKLKHIEIINNKKTETFSQCLISDDYFCLFEYNEQNPDKFILVFYSSIKSLLSFRKSLEGNIITLVWKQISDIKYEMKLTSSNGTIIDSMVETLISKIKKIGFKMDIKKHMEGELPKIDIKTIENEITKYENQLKLSGNLLLFNKLLSHYEKAVEYYSAVNDKRYEIYKKKIQDILGNDQFKKFYIK